MKNLSTINFSFSFSFHSFTSFFLTSFFESFVTALFLLLHSFLSQCFSSSSSFSLLLLPFQSFPTYFKIHFFLTHSHAMLIAQFNIFHSTSEHSNNALYLRRIFSIQFRKTSISLLLQNFCDFSCQETTIYSLNINRCKFSSEPNFLSLLLHPYCILLSSPLFAFVIFLN